MKNGGVVHIEIMVKNLAKAKNFYGKLFGWKFSAMGPEYLEFTTPGGEGGGLQLEKGKFPDGPIILFLKVADIPKTGKKAKQHGGRFEKEKTAIMGGKYGYFGFIRDPFGNRIGIWAKK